MNLSRYFSNLIAGWLVGSDFPTPPTGLSLSLFNGNPTSEDIGNEVTDAGYNRQLLTLRQPVDTVDGYQSVNANEPVFGPAIAGFGVVTHWGIRNQSGQLLLYGQFDSNATINQGSFFYVKTGGLVIRILGFSDNFSSSLLGWIIGSQFIAAPANLELALHTGIVEANDSNLNEVVGGSYVRQGVIFDSIYNVSSGNTLENTSNIIFPTASASWGVVSHWSLRRADTGDMITHGSFLAPKLIESGEGYLIESATLQLVIS